MEMEKYFMKLQKQKKNFVISLIAVSAATILLLFVPIWQLILIPGIIAGLINKDAKRSIYSAIIGVSIVWLGFMFIQFYLKDTYTLLDQFAGFIFGGLGFGFVIVMIILLMGIIFSALGAAVGAYIIQFYDIRKANESERNPEK
jgi:hypothetical protein